ncbi:MAG: cytochrome C, partial [Acidobacteriota bacterium]|nr:cytochrome C [Acidobacteriota bacterium]
MTTLLKIVGVLVALVVVAAVAGLGYLMLAFPKVPPPAVVTLEPTAERLARGKYLSDHVVGCT